MKIVSRTSDKAGELLKRLTTDILDNKNNSNNAVVVHSGRNKIWRENVGGEDVAIKIYGTSLVKSIIYIFRKTKARKAYENALMLIEHDVPTPQPLAFAERRGSINRLTGSVYISKYEETEPLEKHLDRGDKRVLDRFAHFAATLHNKGILHHDLNATNVRVRVENETVTFSLIDINRMKFAPESISLSLQERLENLTRFSKFDANYEYFITAYIKYSNLSTETIKTAIETKRNHDRKWNSRQHRKKFFKKLFHIK